MQIAIMKLSRTVAASITETAPTQSRPQSVFTPTPKNMTEIAKARTIELMGVRGLP